MEAEQTANHMFLYDQTFYGIPLNVWVQNAHKYNCETNNWNYTLLKKGAFGYDNLAVSIGVALSNYVEENQNETSAIIELAKLVHDGWCKNYVFWRDNKPQDNTTYKYIAPYSPLNDTRRNSCAILQFVDLEKEEQEKDIVIARFIYNELQNV